MSRDAPCTHGALWAGLLVGGASRRMGRPKATLEVDGATLAERALAAVLPRVEGIALLGSAEVPAVFPFEASPGEVPATSPATARRVVRLTDAPGIEGPLAGLLAALRFRPDADWIVLACDQGRVSAAALDWLLARHGPGVAAVLPRLAVRRVEPFLALYAPPALDLLERLAASGVTSLQRLAAEPGVITPWPPPRLRPAWRDADTPAELARLLGS